jgi:hypothetical protein
MSEKYKLFKKGDLVGYMELQPKCCETSSRLIWRYSEDGKTLWRGGGRDVMDFDAVERI